MDPAEQYLYSVRMRASDPEGGHVSGAEVIVTEKEVSRAGDELLKRAFSRSPVGSANLAVDRRAVSEIHRVPCLPLVQLPDDRLTSTEVQHALTTAGVDDTFLTRALEMISWRGVPDGGAALVDSNLRMVSPDVSRGIRARHFDFSPAGRVAAALRLSEAGLTHFRTLEALALATKVAWSGVALEVCWSDEPDYLTGYVASPHYGYIRIPDWKPAGAPGGRIFLLDPAVNPQDCIHRLREEWVIIEPPIELRTEPQHG
jgi:6-carboxyhexanoate--CoA ligase